jgi:hypothetical protein
MFIEKGNDKKKTNGIGVQINSFYITVYDNMIL